MAAATETREQTADGQEAFQAAATSAIHLNTADGDSEPLQLQSLCMRCHETVIEQLAHDTVFLCIKFPMIVCT